ncbi:MAG: DeoR family transcriptional regulator [Candidatus Nealsonbacteria bacterium]
MDKFFLIQLTTNLYYLTLLFPKKEPLRYKIRELADDILAALISSPHQHKCDEARPRHINTGADIIQELEILDSFFEVAKAQNWVSPAETLKLQQEYSKLKENLKTQVNFNRSLVPATQVRNVTKQGLVKLSPRSEGDCERSPKAIFAERRVVKEDKSSSSPFAAARLNERQKKILGILKEREKAQVWEIKKIFPEVTKRTLRRDFEQLLKQGFIERIGEKNDTFYQVKSNFD